ncbi:YihY/virulence factor BrkB family protein [Aquimarina agarilytica]|uniref:YihY/virulence factor BrkB family protein n=1 Tax=Aquimarina agarilytica TaxID=1087449 RepID=UPI0002894A22|nr:YihY/virulence factor BrkB family protein [Aquimarina agarilytica]
MSFKLTKIGLKIPGVLLLTKVLKKIVIPGFEGLSIYDLVKMYVNGIVEGAFSTRASAISFSVFTAIFPFLLFLLNLISVIPIDGFQEEFIVFINSLLPPRTSDFFDSIIYDIANKPRPGLLSSTFVLSMVFMTNGINAVFSGFQNSFHTKISRNFLKQYGVAFWVAIIVALFLISTVYIILYFTYLVTAYEQFLIGDTIFWLKFGRVGIFILMIFTTMATLFYFGTKEGRITRFFSPGAVLTTVLIIVTTYLFGFYIDNFSRYNELYGSIGALLILMFYIWINANLVLLGYELNASLRNLKMQTVNK